LTPPILEFRGIGKSFLGVRALQGVSFALPEGHVLGLIGQNGAGKSTLMNVLGGVVRPDEGEMRLAGSAYAPADPAAATRAGVAFIHQELNLFPNLSITDNLFIGGFPRRAGILIDRRAARARATELLAAVELAVPPETPVERLSPGERQLVEIARALSADARIIIFDEPTTSLTARETERLFRLVARLRSERRSMLYISHALEDVLTLADDIVVLRDGQVVDAGPRADFSVGRMISRMVGREMEQQFPPRRGEPSDRVVLDARGVSQPGIVHDVHLRLHAGEVLGVFGLMGSGRTELARILFGLDAAARGAIRRGEERAAGVASPRECIASGMAFVTEDRREEGLMMDASILENMGLVSLPRHARRGTGVLDRGRLRGAVEEVGRGLHLKHESLERQPVRSLSGGNQQKVVIGKWLLDRPEVLILDEPTRGIDVGAKHEVYGIIHELAAQGTGVLMISSEVEELIGMCDRMLVMHNGEVRAELRRGEFQQERILAAAFGEAAPSSSHLSQP
jgi:ribose transport system ATP-binding protein